MTDSAGSPADGSPGRRGRGPSAPPGHAAAMDRPSVLLVDDVADNLFALDAMLRRDDIDLLQARSGSEALELLLEHSIALAILDVQMPGMDGFELAALMRSVERTRHVPIIFVTAASQDERRLFAGYDAGAVDFLFKPIDSHILRSKVDVFVTLEKQRHELRRSEERFRSLVQTTSQAVWRTAADGTVVEDSPSWRELTGMSIDDWLQGRWLDAVHPEDRELVGARWREALQSKSAYEVEYRIRRPRGAFTWTLARVAPVLDDREQLVEWVIANTDIEARKEAENLREMFIAILGHDLRNPLGAILTATQVALRRTQDDSIRAPLRRVISSGERIARMIEQLLDLTRVRLGGGIGLGPIAADLAQIVAQAVSEFSAGKERFRVEIAGDTHGRWDVDRLFQVVSNLASNAAEHSPPERPIVIRIDGSRPDFVELSVHNSGPAIPAEVRGVLFEPFRGTTGMRPSRGLGLGLFITKQLVVAHGGQIRFETSDQVGTTFTVRVPRYTPSSARGTERTEQKR